LACVRHSDIVYNLVGKDYETRNFNFHQVHVDAAREIASICKEAGVPRLVHVSALNASEESSSAFFKSKVHYYINTSYLLLSR
jgi:NADH dehydrogenase (ubiquinone) 1 alpha subcomplex subunit 9